MIPIYVPYLTEKSRKYLVDAYDSGWISSTGGKYLSLVEEKLKEMLNVKYVVLTDNGTTACHVMAKCLKYKAGVNEIIVPNNVYVAAWNAFLYDKNYTLYNTDTDFQTWNLKHNDLSSLQYRANALLVVHNLGNVVNVDKIKETYPNIEYVVEDACEAFIGRYNDKPVGSSSLCTALSFYANKNVTCGEGGALITNDDDVYKYAKLIVWQGQSERKFIHDVMGYNYRMTNIQAAILLGQLESYYEIMTRKLQNFDYLYRKLGEYKPNIVFQEREKNTLQSSWMFAIRFPEQVRYSQANHFFDLHGIETRPFFYPINSHAYLRSHWAYNKNAQLLNDQIVIFPSYPSLKKDELDYIIDKIEEYVISL